MREIRHWLFLVIILCLQSLPLGATELSPSGLWKTVDEHSGKAKGLVPGSETIAEAGAEAGAGAEA